MLIGLNYHTWVIVRYEDWIREGAVTSIAGVPPRLKIDIIIGDNIIIILYQLMLVSGRSDYVLYTFMDPELMLFDKFVQISFTLASLRGRTTWI